jgi:hypothetical protein
MISASYLLCLNLSPLQDFCFAQSLHTTQYYLQTDYDMLSVIHYL